uniref:Uncharacterized protein n=1 Tax=viral metagenome TaxID=1070528 RepID=A0A6C0B514_9ZZZZ
MSNQFVQEPNQNMLWKIVNSTTQLSEFFRVLPPGTKEEWFKGIIHQVYGETYGRNVPLRDINKRALDAMLESIQVLKKRQQSSLSQQQQQQQPSYSQQSSLSQQPQQLQSSVQSSSAFRDSRENQMMDQFNRRQAEYDSMTKKPAPTPVFNDSIKDEAIQDISKAVSEYMSLRDADIIIPSVNPAAPPSLAGTPSSAGPSRIQIAEAISITLDEHEPSNYQKKQVQWGENTEHVFDKTQSIYETALMKKIQNLEEKMDTMVTKMDQIIEDNKKI